MEGLLLVAKPAGITSHDAVELLRRRLGLRRIGHTGTLDPMAEGLLILLVGGATKQQQALQGHDKVYEAVLQLGAQTDTGDAAGEVIRTAPVPPLDRARVQEVLAFFRGPLAQTPPAYSAVKVKGRPAYWWARRRQAVTLASRDVQIHDTALLDMTEETVAFRVACSAGTYIRTLGESIAGRLGTVGHVRRLVRLQIGAWRLADAHPLSWISATSPEAIAAALQPVSSKALRAVG